MVFGSLWNPTAILEVGPLCLSLACCLRRASNTASTYNSVVICRDNVATLKYITNPTATDDTTSLSDECVSAFYSIIECSGRRRPRYRMFIPLRVAGSGSKRHREEFFRVN